MARLARSLRSAMFSDAKSETDSELLSAASDTSAAAAITTTASRPTLPQLAVEPVGELSVYDSDTATAEGCSGGRHHAFILCRSDRRWPRSSKSRGGVDRTVNMIVATVPAAIAAAEATAKELANRGHGQARACIAASGITGVAYRQSHLEIGDFARITLREKKNLQDLTAQLAGRFFLGADKVDRSGKLSRQTLQNNSEI